MRKLPSQQRLKEVVSYDPDTGLFAWAKPRRGVVIGAKCGRISVYGYLEICIDRVLHRAHRLAFVYMAGDCPEFVDHINRDRADNRWANLRAATHQENCINGSIRRNNTSGASGVTWDKARERWRAQARIGGRKTNLGRFADKADAEAAVQSALSAAYGEFAP